MRPVLKAFLLLLLVAGLAGAAGLWYFMTSGVSAREKPGRVEAFVAGRVRNMAIAKRARSVNNTVAYSGEMIAEGRAHFADHCAQCHGNDGSGDTAMGRGLWPPAPDMRLPPTQAMTDGELFAVIENGLRFTGMPAFGDGTAGGERGSWQLVRFIRRLPSLQPADIERMKGMNPRPPDEIRRQLEEEAFLEGRDTQ